MRRSKKPFFSDLSAPVCILWVSLGYILIFAADWTCKVDSSSPSLNLGRDPRSLALVWALAAGQEESQAWSCWRWWPFVTDLNITFMYHCVTSVLDKTSNFFLYSNTVLHSYKGIMFMKTWTTVIKNNIFKWIKIYVQLKSLSWGWNLVVMLYIIKPKTL